MVTWYLHFAFFAATKRPKINIKDCPLEESDSDREETKRTSQPSPLLQQPPNVPTPSPETAPSPDPDLDVEEDTEGEAPENLSLKKEACPENLQSQPPAFMSFHQFPQFPAFHPQYSVQRSPIDVLLRVFPGRRRSDVEALLQR